MSDEPQRRNGMAIASLVCGLFVCVPFAGILAIILGILGLKKTRNPAIGGKGIAIAGIVLGGLGVLMTPDQQAQWANGHADYIYLGDRMKSSADPNTIVLYEKDVHHQIERQKSKSAANGSKEGGG